MHADEPNIVAAIDRAIDECQAIAAEHATDRLVETSPDDVMTAAELAWDAKVVDSFAEIREGAFQPATDRETALVDHIGRRIFALGICAGWRARASV